MLRLPFSVSCVTHERMVRLKSFIPPDKLRKRGNYRRCATGSIREENSHHLALFNSMVVLGEGLRSLRLYPVQRAQGKTIFHGLGRPKDIDLLWSEAIIWICTSLNLTATAVNSPLKSIRDVVRSTPEHPTQAVFATERNHTKRSNKSEGRHGLRGFEPRSR